MPKKTTAGFQSFIFLVVNPTPLCFLRVLVKNYLAYYSPGQQALASHWLEDIIKLNASIFDPCTILRCSGLRHQRQASKLLSVGIYSPPLVISYGRKNRRPYLFF
jgi:hypothetical protein